MADRLPPSRYSVVERGGRLVVVDRETGQTPQSAAERMAEYDRRMGNEPASPAERIVFAEAEPVPAQTEPAVLARAETRPPNPRMAAAVAEMNRKRPWKDGPKAPAARAEPARIAQRPQPKAQGPAGGRKTIVTGKWWDSKGPRTIELGPKGQQTLSGGFITLVVALFIAAIFTLYVQPVLLFIGGFLLFRFGGQILGPIGAGIVDKALAERN